MMQAFTSSPCTVRDGVFTAATFVKPGRTHRRRALVRSLPDDRKGAPVPTQDWRAFRAKLVQEEQLWSEQEKHEEQVAEPATPGRMSEGNMQILRIQNAKLASEGVWAHPTPSVERGGILLATLDGPTILQNESLEQVVVFIVHHDSDGSMGLILNRPTSLFFGRTAGGLRFPIENVSQPVQDVFGGSRVYCGGPTSQQVIHFMHSLPLDKAVQIVPGVYLGGEEAAAALVNGKLVDSQDFKLFSGALVWEPGQLEREIQADCWYSAACSRSLLLKQCIQLPTPLWREMLLLLGGAYAEVAHQAYEGDEVSGE